MSIELNCEHCKKYQAPNLDPKLNKGYCSACGSEMNLSHFTKIQLKAIGQVKQIAKSAYAVRCTNCKTEMLPKLVDKNLVCPKCNNQHQNVSGPFQNLIKAEINSKSKQNDSDND